MRLKYLTAAAVVCVRAASIDAQIPAGEGTNDVKLLSMQDCIQLALEHNLDIQIQRYNPKIAYYTLEGAYGAWDPNMTLSGSRFFTVQGGGLTAQNIPIPPGQIEGTSLNAGLGGSIPTGLKYNFSANMGDQYGYTTGIGPDGRAILFPFKTSSGSYGSASLSQPVLKGSWIGQNRLTIAVNKNRLKYNELGLRQQIITTVTTVKQAYFDLIADEMNVEVTKEAVRLAQQLLDNNRKQLLVGTMAPLDLKQAESQLAQSKANRLAAEQVLMVQQNLVKSLLTDNFSAWAFVTLHPSEHLLAVPEGPDLRESWRAGQTKRPDLLQAKLDLEKIGVQLKFDLNQLFPDLELLGGFRYNGVSTLTAGAGGEFGNVFNDFATGDRPAYNYGASLSFPLSNIAARNQRKQDKAVRSQLELAYKKLWQTAQVAIMDDVKTAESTFEQVTATTEAEDYANEALKAEQKKLESGTSTVFVVLQLQNNLTTARFAKIQALDSYNKNLEQLAADTGATIERNRIILEAR
jgi:outer membrane protein